MQNIPLCDLKKQYISIRDEVLPIIDRICSEGAFIKGPYLKEFEEAFKKLNDAKFGIGCSNGTAAISLALEALGINKDDEVILPSHTFIATAEAVRHIGAVPIFADIKPDDYTIDITDVRKKITSRTKAIIPVHIYGTPCDMDEIMDLAHQYNLWVVEDCAQAHFAKYKGKYVGTFGDVGTYSFYPGKNLGAYGDAGFILCKSFECEEKLRRLIDHGRLDKYDHEIIGYNERLDAIQAAVLSVKLNHIGRWTEKRKSIASVYDSIFIKNGIKVINYPPHKDPVYHVYNIETNNRDKIREKLSDLNIQTGIHYPTPVHKCKPFDFDGCTSLPITEQISNKILSLPIYPEMTDSEIEYVAHSLLSVK